MSLKMIKLIVIDSLSNNYICDVYFHNQMSLEARNFVSNSSFNPLSPHDALKHHITSLKTDLIFLQIRVLEGKFP